MRTLDRVPSEKLVELVVRSVYESTNGGPGGTTVQGISDLQIGTPKGGWSCTAVIESNGQQDTLLVTYDGTSYSDVVQGAGADEPEGEGEAAIATDAADDDEQLLLLAAKTIYGGFDNWEVRGVRNLRKGTPEGGLTVEVVILSEDGEVLRLEGVWDGDEWNDRLLSEDKSDALRVDAPKKGGKKSGVAPKCKTGRPCGMACISKAKNCKVDPTGVVKEALNTVSGGTGGGQGKPSAPPVNAAPSAPPATPKAKAKAAKSTAGAGNAETVPAGISDRNKGLYKSAIDGKPLPVSQAEKKSVTQFVSDAGKNQGAKVERMIKENSKITQDEALALAAYIGFGYGPMAKAVYAPGDNDGDYPPGVVDSANKLAANAARKLEPVTKANINKKAREHAKKVGENPELYDSKRGLQRGISLDGNVLKDKLDAYEFVLATKGGIIREDTWFATSTMNVEAGDVDVAAGSNVIYRIKPKLDGTGQGRYVDHFKNGLQEGEVLYPPFSQFKVTGVSRAESKEDAWAKAGISGEDQKKAAAAVSASYFQTTGKNWKAEYQSIYNKKPPTKAQIDEGMKIKAKMNEVIASIQSVNYVDMEEV